MKVWQAALICFTAFSFNSSIITSITVNGTAHTVASHEVASGKDVYNFYNVGEIDLNSGKNVITITFNQLAYYGPFFRGIAIESK